jgi:hypothetical protein
MVPIPQFTTGRATSATSKKVSLEQLQVQARYYSGNPALDYGMGGYTTISSLEAQEEEGEEEDIVLSVY